MVQTVYNNMTSSEFSAYLSTLDTDRLHDLLTAVEAEIHTGLSTSNYNYANHWLVVANHIKSALEER